MIDLFALSISCFDWWVVYCDGATAMQSEIIRAAAAVADRDWFHAHERICRNTHKVMWYLVYQMFDFLFTEKIQVKEKIQIKSSITACSRVLPASILFLNHVYFL